MPRRARLLLPNVPLHVIQRGNNRQACFFADDDYRRYLDWLEEYAGKCGCRVHAYVLMTNHVHLLLSADSAGGVGALMKALGQRYVQYINRTYRRSGTLWEGRFRSCLTQDETYLLACQRYIELNPVRAAMVAHPAEYADRATAPMRRVGGTRWCSRTRCIRRSVATPASASALIASCSASSWIRGWWMRFAPPATAISPWAMRASPSRWPVHWGVASPPARPGGRATQSG